MCIALCCILFARNADRQLASYEARWWSKFVNLLMVLSKLSRSRNPMSTTIGFDCLAGPEKGKAAKHMTPKPSFAGCNVHLLSVDIAVCMRAFMCIYWRCIPAAPGVLWFQHFFISTNLCTYHLRTGISTSNGYFNKWGFQMIYMYQATTNKMIWCTIGLISCLGPMHQRSCSLFLPGLVILVHPFCKDSCYQTQAVYIA